MRSWQACCCDNRFPSAKTLLNETAANKFTYVRRMSKFLCTVLNILQQLPVSVMRMLLKKAASFSRSARRTR